MQGIKPVRETCVRAHVWDRPLTTVGDRYASAAMWPPTHPPDNPPSAGQSLPTYPPGKASARLGWPPGKTPGCSGPQRTRWHGQRAGGTGATPSGRFTPVAQRLLKNCSLSKLTVERA